jgi:hypothetical protein
MHRRNGPVLHSRPLSYGRGILRMDNRRQIKSRIQNREISDRTASKREKPEKDGTPRRPDMSEASGGEEHGDPCIHLRRDKIGRSTRRTQNLYLWVDARELTETIEPPFKDRWRAVSIEKVSMPSMGRQIPEPDVNRSRWQYVID